MVSAAVLICCVRSLNGLQAWCAQSNDGNQWTVVDLGKHSCTNKLQTSFNSPSLISPDVVALRQSNIACNSVSRRSAAVGRRYRLPRPQRRRPVDNAVRHLHLKRPEQLEQGWVWRERPGAARRLQQRAPAPVMMPVNFILSELLNQGQFPGNVDNVYNQFSVFNRPVKAQYATRLPLFSPFLPLLRTV